MAVVVVIYFNFEEILVYYLICCLCKVNKVFFAAVFSLMTLEKYQEDANIRISSGGRGVVKIDELYFD